MAKKFMWGLLIGSVAGAAYGLLTTPRTGKENQQMMKDYIDGTTYHVQDVSEKLKNLQAAVHTLTEESKNLTTVFTEDVKQSVYSFTYEAHPRIRRIQQRAEVLSKDIQDAAGNISESMSEAKSSS